jgi:hypothetical protein
MRHEKCTMKLLLSGRLRCREGGNRVKLVVNTLHGQVVMLEDMMKERGDGAADQDKVPRK